jgi:hypothetical protein
VNLSGVVSRAALSGRLSDRLGWLEWSSSFSGSSAPGRRPRRWPARTRDARPPIASQSQAATIPVVLTGSSGGSVSTSGALIDPLCDCRPGSRQHHHHERTCPALSECDASHFNAILRAHPRKRLHPRWSQWIGAIAGITPPLEAQFGDDKRSEEADQEDHNRAARWTPRPNGRMVDPRRTYPPEARRSCALSPAYMIGSMFRTEATAKGPSIIGRSDQMSTTVGPQRPQSGPETSPPAKSTGSTWTDPRCLAQLKGGMAWFVA